MRLTFSSERCLAMFEDRETVLNWRKKSLDRLGKRTRQHYSWNFHWIFRFWISAAENLIRSALKLEVWERKDSSFSREKENSSNIFRMVVTKFSVSETFKILRASYMIEYCCSKQVIRNSITEGFFLEMLSKSSSKKFIFNL